MYTEVQARNDQIRFDLIFQTIAPEIEIITPIRDLKLSRQEEVDYQKWSTLFLGKSTIFYQQRTLGNKCWRKRNLNFKSTTYSEAYLLNYKEGEKST
jgi:argininosuccinate synthase